MKSIYILTGIKWELIRSDMVMIIRDKLLGLLEKEW